MAADHTPVVTPDRVPVSSDDDNLYYVGGTNGLHALSVADGHEIWNDAYNGKQPGSLVLTPDGLLVFTLSQGFEVIAVDGTTGKQRWSSELPGGGEQVLVSGTSVLAGSAGGVISAVDLASGRSLWVARPPRLQLFVARQQRPRGRGHPPTARNGSDLRLRRSQPRALDLATGAVEWTAPSVFSSGVAALDTVLVTGTGDGDPGAFVIKGLDPDTGATTWSRTTNQQSPFMSAAQGNVYAWSPISGDGSELLDLDPETGTQRGSVFDANSRQATSGGNAMATVDGGSIYVTTLSGEVAAFAVPAR